MNNINQLVLIFSLLIFSSGSYAQFPGCPDVNAGGDVTLTCADPCVDLNATAFHSGATNTYGVAAIPHTPPIAYNEPGGTQVSVNTDDVWSPIINLPFTFCFYGQNYTSLKIGSNGALQLGPTANGGYHNWSFNASVPSTNLDEAGQIFGIYHDIDPSVAGTVRWYVTGTAPCRIFVVSYNNLGHFSCTTLRSTFMMVLYETTNAIDVYVQQKQTCTTWNGGRAVIGIQNPAGTQGIAAPGRNTGAWAVSTPEAWRFSPDGAPIYSVEWFEGANSIATGNTINVCPSAPTSYTAVATYLSCDGQTVVVQDDVLVTPPADAPDLALDNMVPASCGNSNGELQVSASGGNPGYQYSIDGGTTFQGTGTFTGLPLGSYTITVEDATGCLGTQPFEVTNVSTLDLNFTFSNVSCFGADDGEIILSGVAGSGGYTYSLNGGAPQGSGVFSGLSSGTYDIQVTDSDGCVESDQVEIIEPIELILDLIDSQNISCFGETDGFITVEGSGGTAPLSFDLNGGVAQSSGVFTNLGADNYAVTVTDASGCSVTLNASLTQPTPVSTSVEYEDSPYCAIGTASILQSGVTGGTYSSTTGLALNVTTGEIDLANSIPGVYTVTYSYNDNGCPYTSQTNIEVLAPPVINFTFSNVSCFGADDGEIILSDVAGSGGYTYSLNGGAPQGSGVFSGLSSGTYDIQVTDSDGCVESDQVEIIEPIELILDLIDSQNISCFGETDGLITVTGSGGTGALTFDVNGGSGQATGNFTALGAGSYDVTVTDASGCFVTLNIILTEPTPVPTSIEYSNSPFCALGTGTVTESGVTGGSYTSAAGLSIDATTGEIDLVISSPGVYTVTYSYIDGGCPYTASTGVEIFALPAIDAGMDTVLCEGTDYVLAGQGGVSYVWDNGIVDAAVFTPSVGTITYTVVGTDANGCQNTASVTITVNPTPSVAFTATPAGGFAPLDVQFENTSTGAANYSWDFGNGATSSSTDLTINQWYTEPGSYTVILIGEGNGCTDVFSLQIIVEFDPPVFDIPNVFSPNNDGSNDNFLLIQTSGLENLLEFDIVILNRWGNVIRSFDDPFFQWDGTTENGKDVSEGTYFYKLTAIGYDGEEIMKHGFVQLVRGK